MSDLRFCLRSNSLNLRYSAQNMDYIQDWPQVTWNNPRFLIYVHVGHKGVWRSKRTIYRNVAQGSAEAGLYGIVYTSAILIKQHGDSYSLTHLIYNLTDTCITQFGIGRWKHDTEPTEHRLGMPSHYINYFLYVAKTIGSTVKMMWIAATTDTQ